MKKLLLSATATLSIFIACHKEEMPFYLLDGDAVRIEAVVGTITKSNPLGGTIEEQAKFNEGDRISVTNSGKTVVYKLQSGTWAPENSSEYLKWDKSDLKFVLEYPAGYTTLPTDQSTIEKLTTADRMHVDVTYYEIPENRILSASFFRKNVLVKIKIAGYLDQYKEGETYINYLTIGCNPQDYSNMVGSPLVLDKNGKPLEQYYNKGTVGNTYTAIVSPNKKGENSDKYFIYMNVKGYGTQDSSGDILWAKGGQELLAGYAYTFELYVGKETVKIGSVTVNEWAPGDTLPDGETDPVDTWDGQTTEAFFTQDADGAELGNSEASPILINNCAQLAYLAQKVNEGYTYSGKYFKLTEDLNLADKKWTPIGKLEGCFSGHFDGNNHDILRLNVDGSPYYAGLFGRISGGSVKNVNIRSGSVMTDNDAHDSAAGGIAGHIYNGGQIANCTASVNVSGKSNVGGVVGYIINGSILNCHFLSGEIDGGESVGGIVGNVGYTQADKNTVRSCSANASVKGTEKVGGLCGWFGNGNHKFSNCTMKGSVIVTGNSCGGLVGYLSSSIGTFESCQFEGSIMKDVDNVSNTGIAIGYDESAVTFSECVCRIDTQTYGALNGWEAGSKSDYIGIEVIVK